MIYSLRGALVCDALGPRVIAGNYLVRPDFIGGVPVENMCTVSVPMHAGNALRNANGTWSYSGQVTTAELDAAYAG